MATAWGISDSSLFSCFHATFLRAWPAKLQLILRAAMRQFGFIFAMESSRNHPGTASVPPHEIFLSSHRDAKRHPVFVRRRTQRGSGGVTEDQVCVSCLRFAGRFVSSHWHCVRRPSSYLFLQLRHGLTTAQGDTPGPITPAIMPSIITPIATIATLSGCRAGIVARRKCRPVALPAPTRATWKAAPRWLHLAASARPASPQRRAPIASAVVAPGSGRSSARHAGSVGSRKCRRAVLPTPTQASHRMQASQ